MSCTLDARAPICDELEMDFTIGAKVQLKIEDIAFGGEGVARVGEFVVFAPFVIVGEEVEAQIVEIKKRFARARLIRVLKASPDRVQPPCAYFGACGGCQYQHIDYAAQTRIKHKQIADLFQRVGGFSTAVIDPVIPCPQPYHYRNRIMVRSQWNNVEQKLSLGFLRYDNRLAVDVQECVISEPGINEQLKHVRRNPPPRGGLKVVLRILPKDWDVPPDSFFQNNFLLLPKLVETVRNVLSSAGSRFVIDAYCGVGFFGIATADLVERFVGVELDRLAIKAARKNAAARNITNGEFISGRTEDVLPELLRRIDPAAATVILDPPRTGCPPHSLQRLREVRPAQIIYVSCHPATLARDLNILCGDGVFDLVRVAPLDMFPQTQHVECIADVRLGRGRE